MEFLWCVFGGGECVVRGTPLNRWIRGNFEELALLLWLFVYDDSYGKSIPRASEARGSLLLLEAADLKI